MKLFFVAWLFAVSIAFGDSAKIGTYERLGSHLPLELVFVDEHNQEKTLGEFLQGKPTIISLNYFSCPGICGPQIDGVVKSLDKIQLREGKEYRALTISFAPEDTPDDAFESKRNHLNALRKDYDQSAWNFLVAKDKATIDALTQALGFEYKKIINKQGFVDYIHPAGLAIVSPDGKITRYLNGIKYLHFDVKMALLEASEGKVRPTISKALAFCFSFDPENSKYVLSINKIFATIMLVLIGGYFIYLSVGKRRKKGDSDHES
ncbi:MAG: SCO family protein [Campylobacterales bacterium]|nr:SCO family protein [Campylobacterales bacterium]